MGDISVLYLSRVCIIPGVGHRAHTHDYWHFVLNVNYKWEGPDGQIVERPRVNCWAPGVVNPESICKYPEITSINVMFLVHSKILARKLERISFPELPPDALHASVLEDIAEKIYSLNPNQEFINAAFEYYLRLLLASYQKPEEEDGQNISLTDKALAYIEENYMNQIRVEDVAAHIDRTPNYTSHLLKLATGLTLVEHVREVRIRNACRQLAYSNVPIDEVISSCGFISASYFHRIFREKLGTTPNRYRTSHMVSDTFYLGEDRLMDIPYPPDKRLFTYIPGARKRIDWKTPREYHNQDVK